MNINDYLKDKEPRIKDCERGVREKTERERDGDK